MSDNDPPDVYAAEVVGDGPEKGAIVANTRIKARDLTADHVGKFLGFHTEDTEQFNYTAKVLRVEHFDGGNVPGVSVWLRMSELPDGTPARNKRMHVPFDTELELTDMITY